VGAADGAGGGFGHAEVLDLAGSDELLDCSGDVLDGHVGVHAVLVVQVNHVFAEAAQRAVGGVRDLLRPADQAGLAALVVEPEPELGSDHDLVPHRGEGRADQLLVDVRPVDLSGVEERDTALHPRPG